MIGSRQWQHHQGVVPIVQSPISDLVYRLHYTSELVIFRLVTHLDSQPPVQGNHQWFAIRTKPRQEELAKLHFERQGLDVYLPMMHVKVSHARKTSVQVRPFFSGYLFLHLSPGQRLWTAIRSTVGAIGAVQFGTLYPPLPDMVIEQLKQSEDERGLIELDQKKTYLFRNGDAVRIQGGAFEGFEALFVEMRSEHRAMLLLNWMHRNMSVEVHPSQVANR